METQALDAIKAPLEEQHAKLSAKADALRGELAKLDDLLTRIAAAKAALVGPKLISAAGGLTKKERRKAAAPSATKANVIALMKQELSQGKSIQISELKQRIERLLTETDYSRNGFSLRFKEACSDSTFQLGTNGISLKQPNSVTPSAAVLSSNGHERMNA